MKKYELRRQRYLKLTNFKVLTMQIKDEAA